eukprot:GHVP01060610.1.p2 GENE.GHVP01060610.1~~GHVP01060610.1.p2  ORF type:complete len:282 (-),score=87.44 GHVP01060610.1:67-912(-)
MLFGSDDSSRGDETPKSGVDDEEDVEGFVAEGDAKKTDEDNEVHENPNFVEADIQKKPKKIPEFGLHLFTDNDKKDLIWDLSRKLQKEFPPISEEKEDWKSLPVAQRQRLVVGKIDDLMQKMRLWVHEIYPSATNLVEFARRMQKDSERNDFQAYRESLVYRHINSSGEQVPQTDSPENLSKENANFSEDLPYPEDDFLYEDFPTPPSSPVPPAADLDIKKKKEEVLARRAKRLREEENQKDNLSEDIKQQIDNLSEDIKQQIEERKRQAFAKKARKQGTS